MKFYYTLVLKHSIALTLHESNFAHDLKIINQEVWQLLRLWDNIAAISLARFAKDHIPS